jgi:hypothetical protein
LLQVTRTLSCVLSRRALPVAAILAPPFSPAIGAGSGRSCRHHPRGFRSSQHGYLRMSQRRHFCFLDSPLLESLPSPMDSPLLLHGFSCCFMDSPPPRIPSCSHGFSLLLAWIRPLHLSILPFPPAPMDFANKLRMEGVLHFCRFDIATGYDFSYVSLQ